MILFVNACVREESRTIVHAHYLLEKMNDTVQEVRLSEITFPVSNAAFLNRRSELAQRGDFSDPMFECARTFASADTIVIAAPYWDLSFPAALKQYFEQINVVGLTFEYTAEGFPRSLCRAKKLCYITTAGGKVISDEFGFGYVSALAQGFYGISDIQYIKAEELDIIGADVPGILNKAKNEIDRIVSSSE